MPLIELRDVSKTYDLGEVKVEARQGGIWVVGSDAALAEGQSADGSISFCAALLVDPFLGPNTSPDPDVSEYWPSQRPCVCDLAESEPAKQE